MREIIIASHGDFSKGIKHMVEMIAGQQKNITTYSLVEGESANDFAEILSKNVEENPTKEYVILTDLYGASVCSAMLALKKYDNVHLFAGTNMNLIMELIFMPVPLQPKDIEYLIECGRQGISYVEVVQNEDEDF